MCRNIRPLNNFEPPATDDEVAAAALQFVRKVSGTTKPSQANQEVFDRAVHEIAHITRHLIDDLVTTAPPKDREVEAARRARGRRCGTPSDAVGSLAPVDSHGADVDEVLDFLPSRPLVVLTGAGCSTDSGHPRLPRAGLAGADADDLPGVRVRAGGPAALLGAQPPRLEPDAAGPSRTPGTCALARLDPDLLITQNVDGLHERAGSRRLVALHGRIADVVCLDCRRTSARTALHAAARPRSTPASPSGTWRLEVRPDGDVELDDTARLRGRRRASGCGGRAQAGRGVLRRERARPRGSSAATPRSTRCADAATARCWSPGRA